MDDSNVSSGVDTAAVDMAPPTADASNAPRIKRQRTESSGALDGMLHGLHGSHVQDAPAVLRVRTASHDQLLNCAPSDVPSPCVCRCSPAGGT